MKKMKCPDCGREIVEVPLTLSEEELQNMQYAIDKRNTGNMAMSSDFLRNMVFDTDAQRTAYIKACLDEISEGNFLYNVQASKLRDRYRDELGKNPDEINDFVINNGKLYRHIN